MAILSSIVKVLCPLSFLFRSTDDISNTVITRTMRASDVRIWSEVVRLCAVSHSDWQGFGLMRFRLARVYCTIYYCPVSSAIKGLECNVVLVVWVIFWQAASAETSLWSVTQKKLSWSSLCGTGEMSGLGSVASKSSLVVAYMYTPLQNYISIHTHDWKWMISMVLFQ